MSLFRNRPQPHEVFTPGSPPLEKHNVYVTRGIAEQQLRRYVQRRQVPVVWGEYGVGKTSLVQHFFKEEESKGRLVYIPSVAGLSLSDVFRTILEHLDYRVDIEARSAETTSGEGGIDLKVVKIGGKGEISDSVTRQLVVTSPTDSKMNNIIRDAGLTVVLDEMHKASDTLRSALVDWIKATRAMSDGFTLVLVGTSTDAGRLVNLDFGIDRYIKEMPVSLMTPEESRSIVTTGFERLGIRIASDLVERLVQSAAGAPTIVHSLCLDAAESAVSEGRDQVHEDDLRTAVNLYLQEHGGRLADHYYRAIETTGPRRYRKQILRAAANTNADYVTMEEIRTGVSQALGMDVPSTALSGPLRDLKTSEFGRILKDVDREVSGTRIHNLSTFTDPMMKSFVRFMNNLDDTDLMPSAPTERIIDGKTDVKP